MLNRIIYSFLQAWAYRHELAKYVHDPNLQIGNICDLSPESLFAQGIKCLIIDFDGVLAAHAKITPTNEAQQWLQKCLPIFKEKIYILSNRPTLTRSYYFQQNFPEIHFIKPSKKKPYPDEIYNILHQENLSPHEVIIIDDRLCTGILAASIAKIRGCLVTMPYVDYSAHPCLERLYVYVRCLENKFMQYFYLKQGIGS